MKKVERQDLPVKISTLGFDDRGIAYGRRLETATPAQSVEDALRQSGSDALLRRSGEAWLSEGTETETAHVESGAAGPAVKCGRPDAKAVRGASEEPSARARPGAFDRRV